MSGLPQVPGYAVERLLGEGAYGRVFLAHEVGGLRRPVALKLFAREQRAAYERELEMTRRIEETRRASRAVGLVQALGTGEVDGAGFIALEYLEEGSLADVVAKSGPLSPERAADLARQAGAAVAVLHAVGLFHRDVKPGNLLLGADGQLRLGDFGLSRTQLSGSLSAAGSPAFAAPEVIAGRPVDGKRADVYSLGATLAYLLTGETILPGRPDAFAMERRGAPRALQEVVLRAAAGDPAERFADASAFAAAIEHSVRTNSGASDGPSVEGNEGGTAMHRRTNENDSLAWVDEPTHLPEHDPPEPARTSRRAVGSLICALLVLPTLFVFTAAMRMGVRAEARPQSFRSSWTERDPATGETRYYMEYRDEDGNPVLLGPSKTRFTSDDVPERPVPRGVRVMQVVGIVLLCLPLVLEVLAIFLGMTALSRIAGSAGALTGRGLAIAGLIIAALNGGFILLGGVAVVALVMT